LLGLLIFSPFLIVIYIICYFDTGSPIFIQKRVGRAKQPFYLFKFRSMYINTESVATHLLSESAITVFGSFLRKTKLDESLQLFNVLVGDMSLVGPRPNLFNQRDLIYERDTLGIYNAKPGITGLAQIKKIDMSEPKLLAEIDFCMLQQLSLKQYFLIIFQTILGKGSGDCIKKT
jgi:lipopolysaccharide/colanic/teichoic acid biosynthesis glycosyltransferase